MATELTLIAAHSLDSAIGRRGEIPWHYREDFEHFKRETIGASLIMGRTTYDSIGRPLPGRRTVVLTRDSGWQADGTEVAHSAEEALELTADDELVFGAGGEQVYRALMPLASRQILTTIPLWVPDADAHYPAYAPEEWLVEREATSDAGLTYTWLVRHGTVVAAV